MQLPKLIFDRVQRIFNTKFIINICGNGYNCKIPSIKYDDINRAGFIGRVKIQRLLEFTRYSNSFDRHNMDVFFFGGETTINKKLYDKLTICTPLIMRTNLCKLGKSSIDFKTMIEIDDDSKCSTDNLIITRLYRVINVDLKTRRPLSIPESFREEVIKNYNLSNTLPTFPTLDSSYWNIPEKNFVHRISVRYEDMDVFQHCNQASYTIFTGECASFAAKSGFYRSINMDIAHYPTKYEYNLHKGESRAGDVLDVITWQHEEDDYTAYFVIKLKDRPIYYSKLQFYNEYCK